MLPSATRSNTNSNLDFSILKTDSQKKLFKLLDKFDGTKTIIWDNKLLGAFEFVANASLLKQHDVTRLFKLSDIETTFSAKTDYVLYFLRKDYHVMKCVANILLESDRLSLAKTSLVFVPQRCAGLEKYFEDLKVDLSKLNSIEELPINLFVLDTDLLSIENEYVFSDLYLSDDHSFVRQIVDGLTELQDLFGQIPRISGQGRAAKLVCDLLLKRRKLNQSTKQTSIPQINQLVLIDRRIDLVTPLLTQLTYEGLLDEVFGINFGILRLPAERFNQFDNKEEGQKTPEVSNIRSEEYKRFILRSTEELYAKLRDCHINAVGDVLKQSARNLQVEYEQCSSEGKTIHEMGKIVKRLNHLKIAKMSQSNHVTIAELVNEQKLKPEFIYGLRIEHELLQEDRINRVVQEIDNKLLRQENPLHVLRLICLQSIINNGLKPKVADYYKRELIQNYGIDFAAFLLRLERANLLLCHERFYESGSFNQLRSLFNLIRDDVNECNPNHLSYVYGGYAPLSVVIAKLMSQFSQGPQWRLMSDALPEPIINHSQPSHNSQQHLFVNGNQIHQQVNTLHSSESSSSIANAATSLLMSAGAMASNAAGIRVRRNSATSSQSSNEETKIVLVLFIGGCTYAEISALRFLSQQEENNCEFIIATTKIVNGRAFLASLWPKPDSFCSWSQLDIQQAC